MQLFTRQTLLKTALKSATGIHWRVHCNPDLASSDFLMLGILKRHFAGEGFGDDEELIDAVQGWMKNLNRIFCSADIFSLPRRWKNASILTENTFKSS
ncbi:histone-lysine n-methyltransferase [Elysia marginata]|uniref:Histone-lysine n-methyltransferase n=1 Tax=Elysia marginata TaxID=1093978 RepID=A0AAV4G1Y6_9GAST|nr:histone-lysine n-methyltransferase [Elysia marginata]